MCAHSCTTYTTGTAVVPYSSTFSAEYRHHRVLEKCTRALYEHPAGVHVGFVVCPSIDLT